MVDGTLFKRYQPFAIWASGIWVKCRLLHAPFSHHLHQLGTGVPFTRSIRALFCVRLHGVDGSINPFHEDVHLVRCTLHKLPSILQPLSQWGVSGYRCQPFFFTPRTQDTVHLCPNITRAMLPRVPLAFAPRLWHTQVDQLHLNIWSVCCELSHRWGPLRMPTPGHRLLMFHLLLHNRRCCQVGPMVS